MVLTPVLRADAPWDTAQTELRDHNHVALRSTSPSSATVATQGQLECSAEGDSPQVTGSLIRDPTRAKQVVVGGQVRSSIDPMEAPAKEQPMATPNAAQVGVDESESVPTRQILFEQNLSPH